MQNDVRGGAMEADMNMRMLCAMLVAVGYSVALAVPAAAQTASGTARSATTQTSNQTPAAAAAKRQAAPRPGSRTCIRSTGSHIKPPKGQCLPVIGRTYTRQDIQNTGQTDIGEALQRLDPSVSVTH